MHASHLDWFIGMSVCQYDLSLSLKSSCLQGSRHLEVPKKINLLSYTMQTIPKNAVSLVLMFCFTRSMRTRMLLKVTATSPK